jgi:hypothetical protein
MKVCNRCGKPIDLSDEMVRDFIDSQYKQDICECCDLEITLATTLMKKDVESNQALGTTAKKMLDLYNK